MTGNEYAISTGTRPETAGQPAAPAPSTLRTFALLCVVGGLIAVVGAAWSATVEPVVATEQMSYPFSPNAFRVTEVIWTLTHVLTFFGALALTRTGSAGTGRLARVGQPLMLVGMALLVPAELAFVTTATSLADSGLAITIGSAIGLAATVAGLGFTLTGIAVLREGRMSGWGRWTPLMVGVYELTVLTVVAPLSGPVFLVGIAGWNACLVLLGAALLGAPASVRPHPARTSS